MLETNRVLLPRCCRNFASLTGQFLFSFSPFLYSNAKYDIVLTWEKKILMLQNPASGRCFKGHSLKHSADFSGNDTLYAPGVCWLLGKWWLSGGERPQGASLLQPCEQTHSTVPAPAFTSGVALRSASPSRPWVPGGCRQMLSSITTFSNQRDAKCWELLFLLFSALPKKAFCSS